MEAGPAPMETATETATGAAVLLRMEGISKSFNAVRVLQNVDLVLRRGEVHALLGENGAGKSTLMKIMFGVVQPSVGVIHLEGLGASRSTGPVTPWPWASAWSARS